MRCLCILAMIFSTYVLSGQYYILGRGLDDAEQPYAHSTAELRGKDYFTQQTTTELGVFRFENLKPGSYELVLIPAYRYPARKTTGARAADTTPHHGIAARGTSRTGAGAWAGMPWGWFTLEVTLLRYFPSPLPRTTG